MIFCFYRPHFILCFIIDITFIILFAFEKKNCFVSLIIFNISLCYACKGSKGNRELYKS